MKRTFENRNLDEFTEYQGDRIEALKRVLDDKQTQMAELIHKNAVLESENYRLRSELYRLEELLAMRPVAEIGEGQ